MMMAEVRIFTIQAIVHAGAASCLLQKTCALQDISELEYTRAKLESVKFQSCCYHGIRFKLLFMLVLHHASCRRLVRCRTSLSLNIHGQSWNLSNSNHASVMALRQEDHGVEAILAEEYSDMRCFTFN